MDETVPLQEVQLHSDVNYTIVLYHSSFVFNRQGERGDDTRFCIQLITTIKTESRQEKSLEIKEKNKTIIIKTSYFVKTDYSIDGLFKNFRTEKELQKCFYQPNLKVTNSF